MVKELEKYTENMFEDIKHISESGDEYWEARELQKVLGYSKWENFEKVLDRAMVACKLSKYDVSNHFADVRKIVEAGATTKKIIDYHLSRYACYLIAQNGDSRKEVIALAQTYFAIKTRKMEITEQEYALLSDDEKRLYTRNSVRRKNLYLFDTAKKAGVKNFGKFNDYGYKGLYGGETARDIAIRKNIDPEKEEILDYMGSTELAANLFRITQTDDILKNKEIDNEQDACITHNKVGKAVRETIVKIGGTLPEKLPTPDKSIQELELEELKRIKGGYRFPNIYRTLLLRI